MYLSTYTEDTDDKIEGLNPLENLILKTAFALSNSNKNSQPEAPSDAEIIFPGGK
jgi:hypothetical protein